MKDDAPAFLNTNVLVYAPSSLSPNHQKDSRPVGRFSVRRLALIPVPLPSPLPSP